jgi:hypothetical protein
MTHRRRIGQLAITLGVVSLLAACGGANARFGGDMDNDAGEQADAERAQ